MKKWIALLGLSFSLLGCGATSEDSSKLDAGKEVLAEVKKEEDKSILFKDAKDRTEGIINFDNKVFDKTVSKETFDKIAAYGEPGLYTPEGELYLNWEELLALEEVKEISATLCIDAPLPGILKLDNLCGGIQDDVDDETFDKLQGIILNDFTDWFEGFSGAKQLKYISCNPTYTLEVAAGSLTDTAWAATFGDKPWILGNALVNGKHLSGDVTIPEGVASISSYAFKGAAVTSIRTPETLREIHSGAFYQCADLKEVVLNDGLVVLADKAFENSGLEKINIPKTVKELDRKIFLNTPLYDAFCDSTEELLIIDDVLFAIQSKEDAVTIPATVQRVGYAPLIDKGIKSIVFEGDIENLPKMTKFDSSESNLETIICKGDVGTIGYGFLKEFWIDRVQFLGNVGTIEDCAFSYTRVKNELTFHTVGVIEETAFAFMDVWQEFGCLEIPANTTIEKEAFVGLATLYSSAKPIDITISSGCVVGKWAFTDSNLGTVTIAADVQIEENAFQDATVEKFYYDGNDPMYPWGAIVKE